MVPVLWDFELKTVLQFGMENVFGVSAMKVPMTQEGSVLAMRTLYDRQNRHTKLAGNWGRNSN